MSAAPTPLRPWSRNEELANSLSHACGFVAALIGAPWLFLAASHHHSPRLLVGMGIFALATAFLYLSSAVHHWLLPGKAKEFFEVLDHSAIFLMIAGTYTPFATGVLWGPWGWFFLGIIWPVALLGVFAKMLHGAKKERWSLWLYVAMGWLMVIALPTLFSRIHQPGVLLIVGGGVAYTAGLVFYLGHRFPYHHLAWHLSVLLGTILHYFAVLHYALP